MVVLLVVRVFIVMVVMVMMGIMVKVVVVIMVACFLTMLDCNIPDAIEPDVLQETLQTRQRDGSVFSVSVWARKSPHYTCSWCSRDGICFQDFLLVSYHLQQIVQVLFLQPATKTVTGMYL